MGKRCGAVGPDLQSDSGHAAAAAAGGTHAICARRFFASLVHVSFVQEGRGVGALCRKEGQKISSGWLDGEEETRMKLL